jgi:hypothetical protein
LVEEATHGRIPRRVTYLALGVLALALLWTPDIFAVISYASRAFALYYAIQCGMAMLHAATETQGRRSAGRTAFFGLLMILMSITAALGIPAESR